MECFFGSILHLYKVLDASLATACGWAVSRVFCRLQLDSSCEPQRYFVSFVYCCELTKGSRTRCMQSASFLSFRLRYGDRGAPASLHHATEAPLRYRSLREALHGETNLAGLAGLASIDQAQNRDP